MPLKLNGEEGCVKGAGGQGEGVVMKMREVGEGVKREERREQQRDAVGREGKKEDDQRVRQTYGESLNRKKTKERDGKIKGY